MSDETSTEPTPDTIDDAANGRRRFLTKGAIAAAAAAAGAIALSDTAEAANGNNLVIGANNSGSTGTSNTALNASQFTVSTSLGTYAIRGSHESDTGVFGLAGSSSAGAGTGVHGRTGGGGVGVLGDAPGSTLAGIGVRGYSDGGIGVLGEGGTTSIQAVGLEGRSPLGPPLRLVEGGRTIPPSGSWTQGSFLVDAGHLWYCWKTGTGANAQWVKLSGAPVILDSGYRAYDSRPGEAPLGVVKGVIPDGATRNNIDLKVNGGSSAIPSGISAAIINVTANGTSSAGFFGLFKQGTGWPGTSTINWSAVNTNIANTTIVPVDTQSRIAIRGAGSAHCIIDVIGFLP